MAIPLGASIKDNVYYLFQIVFLQSAHFLLLGIVLWILATLCSLGVISSVNNGGVIAPGSPLAAAPTSSQDSNSGSSSSSGGKIAAGSESEKLRPDTKRGERALSESVHAGSTTSAASTTFYVTMDTLAGGYAVATQHTGASEGTAVSVDGHIPAHILAAAFVAKGAAFGYIIALCVERRKYCVDFTFTAHVFHILFCWIVYTGSSSSGGSSPIGTLTFWVLETMGFGVSLVVAMRLCYRWETQNISLLQW